MIFGTQMVLHDYHHGILNRMFSQETITDVHLYLETDYDIWHTDGFT